MSRLSRISKIPTAARVAGGDSDDYVKAASLERAARSEIVALLDSDRERARALARKSEADTRSELIRDYPDIARKLGYV